MSFEDGRGEHAGSQEDTNPLQISLFEAGSEDPP